MKTNACAAQAMAAGDYARLASVFWGRGRGECSTKRVTLSVQSRQVEYGHTRGGAPAVLHAPARPHAMNNILLSKKFDFDQIRLPSVFPQL